jgi:hypothetical protein
MDQGDEQRPLRYLKLAGHQKKSPSCEGGAFFVTNSKTVYEREADDAE